MMRTMQVGSTRSRKWESRLYDYYVLRSAPFSCCCFMLQLLIGEGLVHSAPLMAKHSTATETVCSLLRQRTIKERNTRLHCKVLFSTASPLSNSISVRSFLRTTPSYYGNLGSLASPFSAFLEKGGHSSKRTLPPNSVVRAALRWLQLHRIRLQFLSSSRLKQEVIAK